MLQPVHYKIIQNRESKKARLFRRQNHENKRAALYLLVRERKKFFLCSIKIKATVMRSKIFIILSLFSLLVFCPVQAADYGLNATVNATQGALPKDIKGAKTLPELAGVIVNVALSLVGILFFALMLYAGVTWMKAMGSSEDVSKAKDMITQAIIGLVIVMAAYAISNFVFTSLGASGGGGTGGGSGTGNGTSPSAPTTMKDGDPCTIDNENWSSGVVLTGQNGQWNCGKTGGQQCDPGAGECQPSCRYSNNGAKCQQATCAGKEGTSKKSPACPVGNCCKP